MNLNFSDLDLMVKVLSGACTRNLRPVQILVTLSPQFTYFFPRAVRPFYGL